MEPHVKIVFDFDSTKVIIVLVAVLIGVLVRVWLHFADKANIVKAAEAKGWKDVVIRWAPFAPGFLFEKGERHYLVTYADADGGQGKRYCKTSLLTGVFWRDETSDEADESAASTPGEKPRPFDTEEDDPASRSWGKVDPWGDSPGR